MPAPPSEDAPSGQESAGGAGEATPAAERRVRLVDVQADRDASSGLTVTVELEWEGEIETAEAHGVGTSTVEIRLGAEATLEALCRIAGEEGFVRLVGVKTVHAFDSEVVLVSVRSEAAPGRNLVGAVPVEGRDPTRTAAAAVLDAVNRWLGAALAG